MLHVWLIPALITLVVLLLAFYIFIRYRGGTGERTDGRTLMDRPSDGDLPPGSDG
jgi:hypothetical protein